MRTALKRLAWVVGALMLLVLVLVGALWVAGNSGPGRALIEQLTFRLTSGHVKLSGLGGSFPAEPTLRQLELIDEGGVWLTADDLTARWSPLQLLRGRIEVADLKLARLHMERAPVSHGSGGGPVSFPEIDVGHFSGAVVELGAPLVGTPASLSAQGKLILRSLEDADADVTVQRLNGDGDYALQLKLDPRRIDAALKLHEPAAGPLEHLLSVPGLGVLAADATVHGERSALRLDVSLTAGVLKAAVQGGIDLTHRSADLEYSLQAAAMAPRSDLAWSSLELSGSWHGKFAAPVADARLSVTGLKVAESTQVRNLNADLVGRDGKATVHALLEGLQVPGAAPRLLADDAVTVDATVLLSAANRPLDLTLAHRLFRLRAHGDTEAAKAGALQGSVEIVVPDLAPFAALAGQDVRGSTTVNAQIAYGKSDGSLSLQAAALLAGGTARWLPLAGPKVDLKLEASLTDAGVQVPSARLMGNGITVSASGTATRAVPTLIQARYQMSVADLHVLSPDVAGDMTMSGKVAGPLTSLTADADMAARLSVRGSQSGDVSVAVHALGLPRSPSGSIRAGGQLDGSPLVLDATLERGDQDAFRLAVRRADWKSAHVEGDLTADAALNHSHGQMTLRIGALADLGGLLGTPLAGSVDGSVVLAPARDKTRVQLELEGHDLNVAQVAGDLHVKAAGLSDAVDIELEADLPKLKGMPAKLSAAGTLDADAHALRVTSAAFAYRGETFKLEAPALVSYASGMAVDDFEVAAHGARFDLEGEIMPALNLRAALSHVGPDLINVFAPGLVNSAAISGQARLEGSSSNPTGELSLDATDVTFADDAATGLPAVQVHAHADLADGTATVRGSLAAGPNSEITVSGRAPLDADGALDLKIGGKMDVGLANPLLEARGLRAAGKLAVDATVTGTSAEPEVGGGINLTQGSLRDYVRGVNLSNIEAEVAGNQAGLEIKSFKATAVSGSVGMTGKFGLLLPGMPVDLEISAKNAQPVASSIVTANLDADIHVSGRARERLDVAGTVHVNRANISIPDSFPPEVAVLDVRRRGQVPAGSGAPGLVVAIDVTLKAPQEILVQGRGLDAELGGDIHFTGTSDEPVAEGSFDLQRGTFNLAGTRLDFTDGRVSFDGAGLRRKIDPTLDFTAKTTISDTTVQLRITGVADAPQFDFSSTPQLPQDEIMARLLFGESAAQLTALQVAQIGAALATLSGVGGNGLNPLVKLQKALGLDRLTVGANTTTSATGAPETSGAAIAAGRYVTKRVYVEGKQTTTGTSQVQVDVDLTKHLKLQTRLGNGTATVQGTTPENDPGSSVGLIYQFEY